MTYPEHFLPEVEEALDPAETGQHGCLLPIMDDPPEGGDDDAGE